MPVPATSTRCCRAQGSWGDVPLPTVPASAFSLPDGSGPGVLVERVDVPGRVHRRVAHDRLQGRRGRRAGRLATALEGGPDSDRSGSPPPVPGAGRARAGGLDGRVVLAGAREAGQFIAGPPTPLQAVVDLEAGSTGAAGDRLRGRAGVLIAEFGLGPELRLGWQQPDSLLDEAATAAAAADAAVVIVTAASGEGMDRDGLAVPGDQDALVARVAAVNRRTVVVLNTPGPVLMPWLDDVAAVLQVWYPGEQFGAALAALLFGDEEPAGRLPLTFPLDRADLPGGEHGPADAPTQLTYDEGAAIGYRSAAIRRSGALFPFGFGLGYARTRHEVIDADVADGESGSACARRTSTSGRRCTSSRPTWSSPVRRTEQPWQRSPGRDWPAAPARTWSSWSRAAPFCGTTARSGGAPGRRLAPDPCRRPCPRSRRAGDGPGPGAGPVRRTRARCRRRDRAAGM